MSVGKHALKYTVAAIAVAAIIIVSTTLYLNQPRTGQLGGSRLAIRLTDPPLVPSGTTSLNLTYSSIALLVGEPASGGLTTKTITVTPSGGSATLDLLKLQNVSQTIGLTSLVNGTVVYSITFTVTGISIDVNGAKSPVTLASGSVLTVTLAHPSPLEGANIALLRLNPVIVNTPTGYQMIPSAVGIIRAAGPGEQNEEQVGSKQVLTNEDEDQLDHARGSLNATLMELSVSGNSTTISVEVKNTGNSSVVLNPIGIHGNFTALGHSCRSNSQTETHTTEKHSNTSTTESTSTSTSTTSNSTESECEFEHADEVVFVPVNATVSGTSCVTLKMELVNGDHENVDHGLTLTKGQCVKLTFSGAMSFGEAKFVLVPSTGSGQVYGVHVIASQGSNLELSCKLPLTAQSCSVQNKND